MENTCYCKKKMFLHVLVMKKQHQIKHLYSSEQLALETLKVNNTFSVTFIDFKVYNSKTLSSGGTK